MSDVAAPEVEAAVPASPYPGLRDYTEEFADLFFGRDAERQRIIGNLRAARLTLLYAQSGVGKSSLLRAGVLPRLRQIADQGQATRGGARYLPVMFSTWGPEPLGAMIDAVADAIRPFLSEPVELPEGDLAAALSVATSATGSRLLVILDQFEELFLYLAPGEADDFAEQLARCINAPDLATNFLISIREDMYSGIGDLLKGRVPNVYGNYLHLDYLDQAAAREAIEKPIESFNALRTGERPYAIMPELVDAILMQVRRGEIATDDAGVQDTRLDRTDRSGIETTYLQLVMKRLWTAELEAGSHLLRLQTLAGLGGAKEIIGTYLDQSMDALAEDQQDIASSVFRFLVPTGGTKIALTAGELAEWSELSEAEVAPILHRLAASDLHILRSVAAHDSRERVSYEIFHDALVRPILDWRTRFARRKAEAQYDRERSEKEAAQRVAALAEERESRERRIKRLAIGGMIVTVALLIAVITVSLVHATNDRNEKRAEAASLRSARRIQGLFGSPSFGSDATALAGFEAFRHSPTPDARDAVLGALQDNVGLPTIHAGHTLWVSSLTYVTDSILASGSGDGTVLLWDDLGHRIRTLRFKFADGSTDTKPVTSIAVGRHGDTRTLAAVNDRGRIYFWNVNSPRARQNYLGALYRPDHEVPLNAVAFAPDGSLVVAGGDAGELEIWDASQIGESEGAPAIVPGLGTIRAVAFDATGTHLAIASSDGVATLSGPDFAHSTPVWLSQTSSYGVAYSPDGTLAWTVDSDEGPGIALANAAGDPVRMLATADAQYAVAFARGGAVLVSGGDDDAVTTWDVATGREFGPPRTEAGSQLSVDAVAVSPSGEKVAGGGESKVVKVWRLDARNALASTVGSVGPGDVGAQVDASDKPDFTDLAISSDGRVAAAAGTGGASIWDASDNSVAAAVPRPITSIPAGSAKSNTVAAHGKLLAVGSGSSVALYDTGRSCTDMPTAPCPLGAVDAPAGSQVTTVRFDPRGRLLAVGCEHEDGSSGGSVGLWDVSNPRRPHQLGPTEPARAIEEVAFGPRSDVLVTGSSGGNLRLWMVTRTGLRLRGKPQLAHGGWQVGAIAFAPAGTATPCGPAGEAGCLASGGYDQEVKLWAVDPNRLHPFVRVRGQIHMRQENVITAIAFSPSGRLLAAGDGNGTLCLWDPELRDPIGGTSCVTGHDNGGIDALAFLPGDQGLVTAGAGEPIVRWSSVLWGQNDDKEPERLRRAVCAFARRELTNGERADAFLGTELAGNRDPICSNTRRSQAASERK